jgi:hypothetical protein
VYNVTSADMFIRMKSETRLSLSAARKYRRLRSNTNKAGKFIFHRERLRMKVSVMQLKNAYIIEFEFCLWLHESPHFLDILSYIYIYTYTDKCIYIHFYWHINLTVISLAKGQAWKQRSFCEMLTEKTASPQK